MQNKTRKQIKTDHHRKQVESGNVLAQVYVRAEIHERVKRLAQFQGVPLAHIYSEALQDYLDPAERDAAAAALVTLQSDEVRRAHAANFAEAAS